MKDFIEIEKLRNLYTASWDTIIVELTQGNNLDECITPRIRRRAVLFSTIRYSCCLRKYYLSNFFALDSYIFETVDFTIPPILNNSGDNN